MLSKYCPKCSKPNFYQLDSPIICGFCGANLNDLGISIAEVTIPSYTNKSKISLNRHISAEIAEVTIPSYTNKSKISLNRHISAEDEIDENTEIPNIEKLEIEPIQPENRGIKLGVVAKQGKTGFTRPKGPKMTVKQVEEIFKKEAIGTAKLIEIGGGEEE